MSISVEQLLAKIPDDTMSRVDQTRKRIGPVLREALRKETGLMLNRREREATHMDGGERRGSISVPVALVPGIPTVLEEVSFEDHYWLVSALSRWRGTLLKLRDAARDIQPLIGELRRDERGRAVLASREQHFPSLVALADELLQALDRADPVRRILEVNEDVLGRYVYRLPPTGAYYNDPWDGRIELYWGVIGLIAGLLGCSVESLTVVVLAHELAHAYTHLGADIDGRRWDSLAFANSTHELIEGLAQYYTYLVCYGLETQMSDVLMTYKELLEHQPDAYRTHNPWVENFKPEGIRLAMLEVRRRGIATGLDGQQDFLAFSNPVEIFEKALEAARERLRF
jgi:hypothetical protein